MRNYYFKSTLPNLRGLLAVNFKVSVIIPVYNVEPYLSACLDSVCHQTLRDIEIICINDGSTDRSLDILQSYAERDSRIQVYSQENRGPGEARNAGIYRAHGEYIQFMDSDDMLEPDVLLYAYEKAKAEKLDVFAFDAHAVLIVLKWKQKREHIGLIIQGRIGIGISHRERYFLPGRYLMESLSCSPAVS